MRNLQHFRTTRRASRGFTLIELLVVVAIVAILAAIAMPSYSRYVYRARRAEGHDVVMALASAQERFYTNFNRYATTLTELGLTTAQVTSPGGNYVASIEAAPDTQSYLLQATPQEAQVADVCGNLTLTNTGVKDYSGDHPSTNGNCW